LTDDPNGTADQVARMLDEGDPNAADSTPFGGQGTLEPYEVFRQAKDGDPMRHGGNVMAPDPELAVHYAREMFSRRGESVRLWVVRRADINVLEDLDLLQPPLDRSFKKPSGYAMRDKLAAARDRAGTTKPGARAASHDTTGRRGPEPGPENGPGPGSPLA
jgi:ring-1,2-phenylacetyl-CoA epoxidase subunit PaaB